MKNIILLFLSTSLCLSSFSQERKKCRFDEIYQDLLQNEDFIRDQEAFNDFVKKYKQNKMDTVITIPTVVHVLYKNATENVSLAQIQSQLNVLNDDYGKMNADTSIVAPGFSISNVKLNFQLALKDPNGNSTSGITRTFTTVDNVGLSNQYYQLVPAWNRDRYLNIWVCEVGNDIAGFAYAPNTPGVSPAEDGLVIDYTNFGTVGTAAAPYDKGRTATHEIGHFFNLLHPWGRFESCSNDDLVTDTPNQQGEIYGCPSNNFSCGSNDMVSNFMGYVDDRCMANFTLGQKLRMRAALDNLRDSLRFGNLLGLTSITENTALERVQLYPNPTQTNFTIETPTALNLRGLEVRITNLQGQLVQFKTNQLANGLGIEIINAPKGIYFVQLSSEKNSTTKKIVLH